MPARLTPPRPSVVVNVLLGLALAGGAVAAYRTVAGPGTPQADAAVRTVTVRQGPVTASVTADGSVESAGTASASFVTGGTVTGIDVHVGQLVRKGQTLAVVDPAAADRALAAAQADLTAARDALTRARDAGSDTSTAQNQVTQDQLAVDDAEAAVAGTVLKAPAAGTVVAVNGTIGGSSSGTGSAGGNGGTGTSAGQTGAGQISGGQISGGQISGGGNGAGQNGAARNGGTGTGSSGTAAGFIDLADLSRLQVTAGFAEADATKLKTGQAATVTWNALSGTAEPATVAEIDPQATTTNNVVTYGVTLTLHAVPPGAKPGQTVSVSVTTGSVADAVYVNSAAVTTVGTRHTVTVEANGQRAVRVVQIGLAGEQNTQITAGLQPGEQVVVPTAASTSGSGTFPGGGARFGGGFTRGGAVPGAGGPGGGVNSGTTGGGR